MLQAIQLCAAAWLPLLTSGAGRAELLSTSGCGRAALVLPPFSSPLLAGSGRARATAILPPTSGTAWAPAIPIASAYVGDDEEEGRVLVDNKCKCVKATSRFVPSKDKPDEEVLERNIQIVVPLKSRQNISDPTSPVRTTFVYRMSELCKKCDPVEMELGDQVVTAGPSNNCSSSDTCYTYDRNKCYTTTFPFSYEGKTHTIQAALTPESCYPD
ncbi:immunoglobulin J chain [Carettochelys insculpta]|uniref:immunoglobulin J chain n=1 Tax=Carettochelys insculpta TaxID=44489 RepID=UPI003EB9B77A